MPAPGDDLSLGARTAIRQGGFDLRAAEAEMREGRTRPSATPLNRHVGRMESASRRFYERDFEASYLLGARRAGVADYEPTKAERRWIEAERASGLADANQATEFAKRDARRLTADLRSGRTMSPSRRRVRGMRYSDGRFYRPEHYLDAQIDAKNATAYNRGIIMASSRRLGVQAWEISDGPDCGLTSHGDAQRANGLIVDRDTALANTIAHPHCSRTFVPRPDLDPPEGGMSDAFGRAVKAALALNAAALGANVALSAAGMVRQTEFAQRIIAGELRGTAIFREFATRVAQVRTHMAHVLHAGDNIIDLETRRRRTLGDTDVIEYVDSYQDDVARRRPIPQEVAHVLGLTGTEDFPTIAARMGQWDEFREAYIRANNLQPDTEAITRLDSEAQQAIFDWIGPRSMGERFVRLSFPDMGGAGRRPRLRLLPESQDVRATLSLTRDRGLVPDIRLNNNGLVRAGGQFDPTSGQFFPNLSVVPRGPLRVETRINRAGGFLVQEDGSNFARALQYATEHGISHDAVVPGARIGTGHITSVSVKVRLIARMDNSLFTVANPTLNLRVNLRNLGLHTLRDIRNLSLEDFRKLKLGDLKVVSTAAEFRLRGFGPFHLSKKLRINFDDARRLYELAAKKILSDADTSPFATRLSVRQVVEGQALTSATALVEKAQSFVDTIIGLSDGRLTVDLDVIKHQLLRQLKPFAPRAVVEASFDLMDETARKIFDALQSDRRVNDIIKTVAELQLDMLQRLNIRANVLDRARSEVLEFFRAVPAAIRPTAEIFEFRLRALIEGTIDEGLPLIHDTSALEGSPALFRDANRVARFLEREFPQAPPIRFLQDDLGGLRIDENGRARGNWAVWRAVNGEYTLTIDSDFYRLYDTEAIRRASEIYRSTGYTNYDRDDPIWVLLHEVGHHLTISMGEEGFTEYIRRVGRRMGFNPGETLQEMAQYWDTHVLDLGEDVNGKFYISGYGATVIHEGFAELLGQAMFNRRPSRFAQVALEELQDFWGPNAPYRRDFLGQRAIPVGPARFGDFEGRLLDQAVLDEATAVRTVAEGVGERADGFISDHIADKFVFWTPDYAIDEVFSIRTHTGVYEEVLTAARKLAHIFRRAGAVLVQGHEEIPFTSHGRFDTVSETITLNNFHFRESQRQGAAGILEREVDSGWAPRNLSDDTSFYEYILTHEYGHALSWQALGRRSPRTRKFLEDLVEHFAELGRLSNDGFDRNDVEFWGRAVLEDYNAGLDPIFSRESRHAFPVFMINAIEEGVSDYASENLAELLAEAFAEGMLAPNPGPIARLVRDWLLDEFG